MSKLYDFNSNQYIKIELKIAFLYVPQLCRINSFKVATLPILYIKFPTEFKRSFSIVELIVFNNKPTICKLQNAKIMYFIVSGCAGKWQMDAYYNLFK